MNDTNADMPRVRTHQRLASKEPVREDVRDPVRGNHITATGRDGRSLSRKRGGNVDRFHVPPELVPRGWTYEWKRELTVGQEDTAHLISLQENGWTPVMASTHEGYFMPAGYSGPIRRDGMILMERPAELTAEARAEEQDAASTLMRTQREQLGLQLPSGFDGRHRGLPQRVSQTYAPADASRPRLRIDD